MLGSFTTRSVSVYSGDSSSIYVYLSIRSGLAINPSTWTLWNMAQTRLIISVIVNEIPTASIAEFKLSLASIATMILHTINNRPHISQRICIHWIMALWAYVIFVVVEDSFLKRSSNYCTRLNARIEYNPWVMSVNWLNIGVLDDNARRWA